ncbi:hypothetical protein GQR58_012850 [Nymphon striatum]|nr:hypothetical protein GQR58_012850 [Nymphon striatum]
MDLDSIENYLLEKDEDINLSFSEDESSDSSFSEILSESDGENLSECLPCLGQTLAIMVLHSDLFSAILKKLLLLYCFCVVHVFRLPINVVLCLPLLLLPSIFPVMDRYSKSFCLQMCPKNSNCLRLTFLIKDLVTFASFNTESFVLFSVHDIIIILLISHISVATSFLSISLLNVQHSHPYKSTDHT